ncbi:MAG: hypothetical protein ACJAW1_000948 [Glaciecola sp.]|jgi:uncharacterized protein (DUF2252 family)
MTSRADFINQQLLLIDGQYAGASNPKHLKMRTSPFVFYRGTAQLFYADLAVHNLAMPEAFLDVPLTTVMGDCHASNFGFFTEEGSFGEHIVFSLNDFDDACIGYAYWDILRYLVSLALAADHGEGVVNGKYESNKDYSNKEHLSDMEVAKALQAFLDGYIDILTQAVKRKDTDEYFLDQTFTDFKTPSPLSKRYKKAQSAAVGGEFFMSNSALAKAVDLTRFPLRFQDNPDKYSRKGVDKSALCTQLSPYFYHDILDVVKRINSGTSSVNMDRFYLLIGPRDEHNANKVAACHVVEVKQQRTAAPIYYFPELHHQNQLNPSHLTVKCQHRMQRKQDYCLDEAFFQDSHWLIRSRHHTKVGFDPEHITLGKVNANEGGFSFYAEACANALARAHGRGDKSSLKFESAMLQALTHTQAELIDLAKEYAQQVKQDWHWFCQQR